MTTEQWGTLLVYLAFPAANAFATLYAVIGDWRGRWVGWAVMISKFGFAGLVDAATLVRWLGPNYPYRAEVVLVAFGTITVGTYLYLFAFLRERWLDRRRRKARNTPGPDSLLDDPTARL